MQGSLPDTIERHSFVAALHAMSGWPLADLFEFIDSDGERAQELGTITVAELLLTSEPKRLLHAELVSELAPGLSSDRFDQIALSILNEVYPDFVKAGFLRERLGVPRWRVQTSMLRLVKQGKVIMYGKTSDRVYGANHSVEEAEQDHA